jgi:aminopeptidase N
MSSYLLAFVVSDFAYRAINNGPSEVEQRVYGRVTDSDKFELALTSTDLLLKALEEFCYFKYELPKLGHVAVPDFSAGAVR